MGATYLLDTNIVSKTLRGLLAEAGLVFMQRVVEQPATLSVISRIELLGWVPDNAAFAADLKLFVQESIELGLTEPVILQTITIRKQVRIKLPDAIIAATAIVHNLTLLSDNDSDFLRVPRLKYLNPARI